MGPSWVDYSYCRRCFRRVHREALLCAIGDGCPDKGWTMKGFSYLYKGGIIPRMVDSNLDLTTRVSATTASRSNGGSRSEDRLYAGSFRQRALETYFLRSFYRAACRFLSEIHFVDSLLPAMVNQQKFEFYYY